MYFVLILLSTGAFASKSGILPFSGFSSSGCTSEGDSLDSSDSSFKSKSSSESPSSTVEVFSPSTAVSTTVRVSLFAVIRNKFLPNKINPMSEIISVSNGNDRSFISTNPPSTVRVRKYPFAFSLVAVLKILLNNTWYLFTIRAIL